MQDAHNSSNLVRWQVTDTNVLQEPEMKRE
jgi:hypothetical protein